MLRLHRGLLLSPFFLHGVIFFFKLSLLSFCILINLKRLQRDLGNKYKPVINHNKVVSLPWGRIVRGRPCAGWQADIQADCDGDLAFKPPANAFAGVCVGSYSCSTWPVIISSHAVTRPRDDRHIVNTKERKGENSADLRCQTRSADRDGTLIFVMYVMRCNPTFHAYSSLDAQRVLCKVGHI